MQDRSFSKSGNTFSAFARWSVVWFAILLALSSFGQSKLDIYRLGPEDQINISVRNHVEYSGDIFIPSDGVVDLPIIGMTKVSGLTLVELKATVVKALKSRLIDPEVNVNIKSPRLRRIYVEGAVKVSTAVDFKPGFRITECLAGAGGLQETVQPTDCKVTVLRVDTNKVETVLLVDVLAGKVAANLHVFPGDVVTFRAVDTVAIYVVGEVRLPGVIRARTDQTGLLSSIALAGGFLPTASTAHISITHINGLVDRYDVSGAVVRGEKMNIPPLQPGDLVNVPELQTKLAVTGLVKAPGLFPLADGRTYHLSDAIALAGGNEIARARMSRVVILRNDHGKAKRIIVNYGLFLKKGDVTKNVEVLAGDVIYVPETNSIDWSQLLQGAYTTFNIINGIK